MHGRSCRRILSWHHSRRAFIALQVPAGRVGGPTRGRALPTVYHRLRRSGRSPALPYPPSRHNGSTSHDATGQAPRRYRQSDKRSIVKSAEVDGLSLCSGTTRTIMHPGRTGGQAPPYAYRSIQLCLEALDRRWARISAATSCSHRPLRPMAESPAANSLFHRPLRSTYNRTASQTSSERERCSFVAGASISVNRSCGNEMFTVVVTSHALASIVERPL